MKTIFRGLICGCLALLSLVGISAAEAGSRNLDGVPGLFVMSEYEWWDARLEPLLKYQAERPAAPIALLADVGHSHFDVTDSLVEFLSLFLRKAAAARLPLEGTTTLRDVDPSTGWLVDRWRGDEPARAVTQGKSVPSRRSAARNPAQRQVAGQGC